MNCESTPLITTNTNRTIPTNKCTPLASFSNNLACLPQELFEIIASFLFGDQTLLALDSLTTNSRLPSDLWKEIWEYYNNNGSILNSCFELFISPTDYYNTLKRYPENIRFKMTLSYYHYINRLVKTVSKSTIKEQIYSILFEKVIYTEPIFTPLKLHFKQVSIFSRSASILNKKTINEMEEQHYNEIEEKRQNFIIRHAQFFRLIYFGIIFLFGIIGTGGFGMLLVGVLKIPSPDASIALIVMGCLVMLATGVISGICLFRCKRYMMNCF